MKTRIIFMCDVCDDGMAICEGCDGYGTYDGYGTDEALEFNCPPEAFQCGRCDEGRVRCSVCHGTGNLVVEERPAYVY